MQRTVETAKALRNSHLMLTTAVLTLIFMTGCGMMPGNNTSTNANSPAANTASNAGDNRTATNSSDTGIDTASKCYNEYYPVSESVTRKFNTTGTVSTAYTLKYTDVTNEGFAEERKFDTGIVVNNTWICTDEGLRTAEYTNSVQMDKAQMKMDTITSSGITLPKIWTEGKEWDTDFTIKADLNAGPISRVVDGTVIVKNKIVSMSDKVTAGGKEYDAVKVDSYISINISMKEAKVPSLTVKTTNWYAKGVGLVKQDAGSTMGSQKVEFVGTN